MQISRALGDVHLYTKTWEPRSAIEWCVERIGGGGFPGIVIGRDPSVFQYQLGSMLTALSFLYDTQPLCNVTLHYVVLRNVTLSFSYPEPLLLHLDLPLCCCRVFLPMYHMFRDENNPLKNSNHTLVWITLSSLSLWQCRLCVVP